MTTVSTTNAADKIANVINAHIDLLAALENSSAERAALRRRNAAARALTAEELRQLHIIGGAMVRIAERATRTS